MVLHNTTSDPYCGVVPMFNYSFIMAPYHREQKRKENILDVI